MGDADVGMGQGVAWFGGRQHRTRDKRKISRLAQKKTRMTVPHLNLNQ